MEIPFFWPSLGFSLGILLHAWIAVPERWCWAGFCSALLLLWLSRGRRIFLFFLVIAFACLGNLFSNADQQRPEDAVEKKAGLEDRPVWLEGRMMVHPEIKQNGKKQNVSFVLAARRFSKWDREKKRYENRRVSGKVQVFLIQPSSLLPEAGDWVRIYGRLEIPKPVLNPGGFDYRKYLAGQNIFCILSGYGKRSFKILRKNQASGIDAVIFWLQKRIAEKMDRLFQGDIAILFKALVLGTRRGLSPALREDFYRTGTSHLLAISGLNISLVAGSLYLMGILTGLPQKIAAFAAFVTTLFQVLIAGGGMPVARAGIMAGIGFWGVILNREKNSLNALFFAFFALLVLDTRSLGNISFQLSFLSVFALMVFMGNPMLQWRWLQWVSGSLAVLVMTFPLTVIYFHSFAPVGIFANIAGIPLFDLALLTVLMALASPFPVLSIIAGRVAEFFLKAALAWIHLWSQVPGGYFHVPAPAPGKAFFYYGFLLLLTLAKIRKWNLPLKWFAGLTAGWMVSAVLFFWPLKAGGFQLTLFSAGRNEIAALDFDGVRWLVNTGRNEPSRQAEWVVTPYFRARGVQKLAGILLSDTGRKHTGGLETLARQFQLEYVLFPGGNGKAPDFFARSLKIKRYGMNPGGRVSMKNGGEIQILDIVDGKMIFAVREKGKRFLFLPAVNKKMIESLKSGIKETGPVDLLVLPGFYFRNENLVREIAGILKPARVSAPFISPELREFFAENRIPVFCLEKEGSLTLRIGKDGGILRV